MNSARDPQYSKELGQKRKHKSVLTSENRYDNTATKITTEKKQSKLGVPADARPSSRIKPKALFSSGLGESGAALRMNGNPETLFC